MAESTKLASTDLWAVRLHLPEDLTVRSLTEFILETYVEESTTSFVGYFEERGPSLTALRWPETRSQYVPPLENGGEKTIGALGFLLAATATEKQVVEDGWIHCMMGRKLDGYAGEQLADLVELDEYHDRLAIRPAHMISARTITDGLVPIAIETYGEPVVVLEGPAASEPFVHEIAHRWRQHHYVIDRSDANRSDLYETPYARTA